MLAGVLSGLALLLAADALLAQAVDLPDPPRTSVVDHTVTWARDPEEKARLTQIDEGLLTRCRESRFVVVTFSGTGMETSHYQANMIQGLVEDLGGCVLYHWYGHAYDPDASARSVAEAIADVTPVGRRKPTMFIGASFGGIAAEDVAAHHAVRGSAAIDLVRIVMVATPVDMNDVVQDVFGVPVPLIKDIPVGIPRFGALVVLGNAVNGQRQRGGLGDLAAWEDTFINAAKTRPVLMWSQLERLRRGMLLLRTDVAVDYLGAPLSDQTVDTRRAYDRVAGLVLARTRFIAVPDGGHDRGWLLSTADTYNAALGPLLSEAFGAVA